MKHFKIFVTALLIALPLQGIADDGVRLLLKDGSKVEFALSRHPKLVLGDQSITFMTADGENVQYQHDVVQQLSFCDVSTGIATVKEESSIIVQTTYGGIYVTGLPVHDTVSVYSLDGKKIASGYTGSTSTRLFLKLPGSGSAIYILQTKSGYTKKFITK